MAVHSVTYLWNGNQPLLWSLMILASSSWGHCLSQRIRVSPYDQQDMAEVMEHDFFETKSKNINAASALLLRGSSLWEKNQLPYVRTLKQPVERKVHLVRNTGSCQQPAPPWQPCECTTLAVDLRGPVKPSDEAVSPASA